MDVTGHATLLIHDVGATVPVFVTNASLGQGAVKGSLGPSSSRSASGIAEGRFLVANFPDFLGEPLTDDRGGGSGFWAGRLDLTHPECSACRRDRCRPRRQRDLARVELAVDESMDQQAGQLRPPQERPQQRVRRLRRPVGRSALEPAAPRRDADVRRGERADYRRHVAPPRTGCSRAGRLGAVR